MVSFFSEHYAETSGPKVAPPNVIPATRTNLQSGISRSALFRDRAHIDFVYAPREALDYPTMSVGDQIRILTLRSSDRVDAITMFVPFGGVGSWEGVGPFSVTIGLCESGTKHDGSVIDLELFAYANLQASIYPLDALTERGNVVPNHFIGLMLWQMAVLGTMCPYKKDPLCEMDIVATFAKVPEVVTQQGSMTFHVDYARASK